MVSKEQARNILQERLADNLVMGFHGKMFRDNEVAFVYVYDKPVDETKLVLQTEEVEEVRWFDIEEVVKGCEHRDGTFCVPTEGLETVMKYLGYTKE